MKAMCFIELIQKGIHTHESLISLPLPREKKVIRSLVIYAVEALQQDALHEIERGIKAFIKGSLRTADREGRQRLKMQEHWLKDLLQREHPFDNSHAATQRLILTLATSLEAIPTLLKHIPHMDVYEWVRQLYDMVSPPEPAMSSSKKNPAPHPGAPLFKQGAAQEVLTQVFDALRQLYTGFGSWAGEREFCVDAMVYQMGLSHIYRYPHSSINHSRRSIQWAQYDSWVNLSYPTQKQKQKEPEPAADPYVQAASIASTQITESNPQASWNWEDVKLCDLSWIVKRSRLPLDWIQEDLLDNPICNELTDWVTANYDGGDARFHISLIAALILAAWAPSHRVKIVGGHAKGRDNMTEYAHSLPWDHEHGKSQVGWKQKEPIFHLWIIFISSVLVEGSPWWQRQEKKLRVRSIKKKARTTAQGDNASMMSKFNSKLRMSVSQHSGGQNYIINKMIL
jgi:hypothetical protein